MSLTMKKRRVTVVVPNTRLGRMKAQAIRTADVIGPMAGDARDVAASRIEDARYWMAPRLDRAAVSVEKQLAPKVSSMLSDAAKIVNPAPTAKLERRWPVFAFGAGLALGVIGFMMYRRNRQRWAESVKETSAEAGKWVSAKARGTASRVSEKSEEVAEKAQSKSSPPS